MRRFCKLIVILLTLSVSASAQDIHFSQFFEAPLLRNPSLAGIFTGDVRVQAVYRDQWNSITDAYKTASLNAEYKMPVGKSNDFLTLGLQTLYDRAGTVSWISAHFLPAVNYHKSLSSEVNRYLSLGFMAGVVSRRFDRSKMTTNTQYNGGGQGENFIGSQYSHMDASVGMSFNTQLNENPNNNMFVGLAYHHFTKPQNSFYRTQNVEIIPKWVASAGVRFEVTPISYLTLQGDFSKQGEFNEAVAGALYGIKLGDDYENPLYTIHGGAFLRWNDALIPTIKIDYKPFSMSFSYDVNVSKLKTSTRGRGGFEASVSYIGFLPKGTINSMLCPKF
jgi:type IX secretion system PorP/SprF family membrane protein